MSDSLFPRMVQEYTVERVRRALAARAERLGRVRSAKDVRRYQSYVRARLEGSFGPMPERTPLKAVTTGVVRRKPYTIENVIFESRPGYKVTANLYVPTGGGPFPVVLEACGHSGNGKAYAPYQALASGLARRGIMVLCYDPVGQGERVQITRPVGAYRVGNMCHEHNQFGNRMALYGDFFGTWRMWDGIRGLDYLLSRPEADASHVGVTGTSGGGTLTSYISAFDDRVNMVAVSCYVTSLLCNTENELPADSEQNPPGILADGLDIADFYAARVPRPLLMIGQKQDFFDVRGLLGAYEDLRRLYVLSGAEEDVQLVVGKEGHALTRPHREAIYRFFGACAGRPGKVRPSESQPEPDEALWAARGGSVLKAGARNLTLYVRDGARAAEAERPRLAGEKLRTAVRQVLALPEREGAPHHRVLPARPAAGKVFRFHLLYAVETEPGMQAALHLFTNKWRHGLPDVARATVYVPHVSSEDDARDGLLPDAREVCAVDVRGLGLSMPATCGGGDFFQSYGADFMYAVHGQMLREPYLGRRVHDLLCVLDLLEANGCGEIHLAGRGLGSIIAAFAGCLHGAVRRVTLRNAPASYTQMCEHLVSLWPGSVMAQGLLRQFDLPDVYRLLRKEKGLRMVEPWDHMMRRI